MQGKAVTETQEEENDKDDFIELAKAMAVAALIALVIRSFLFEPFNIPSGSLLPTLQIGDYLFVEKYAYGYSKHSFPLGIIDFDGRVNGKDPARGDIAVFRLPTDPKIVYIKRIVGLPGDTVQVKGGSLFINDKPVMRDLRNSETVEVEGRTSLYRRYIETLPNGLQHYIYEISDTGELDNTQAFKVPQGFYFAMGDNRDSSQDSRVMGKVGFIPAENLVGRAWFIFFSIEDVSKNCVRDGTLAALRSLGCRVSKWPGAIRYSRIFKKVQAM